MARLADTPRPGPRHPIGVLCDQARAGRPVEVGCGGGIGRTGTVMACLAVLAGLSTADAIAWARSNYHRRAIETPWQRRWVAQFPGPAEPARPAMRKAADERRAANT